MKNCAIFDKLSASGYGSLTDEEKRILFQESNEVKMSYGRENLFTKDLSTRVV